MIYMNLDVRYCILKEGQTDRRIQLFQCYVQRFHHMQSLDISMKYRNKFELHVSVVHSNLTVFQSQYAPMALSSSEEEESLLISISIFCLYKEQKHSFKRLVVVTCLTFGVLNLLHVHFHCKFGSFQLVKSFRDCAQCAF